MPPPGVHLQQKSKEVNRDLARSANTEDEGATAGPGSVQTGIGAAGSGGNGRDVKNVSDFTEIQVAGAGNVG